MNEQPQKPRLIVFSSLFPHSGAPHAGVFIRERMFRVAKSRPLTVIVPQPWFPGQALIRQVKPYFRPPAPSREVQDDIEIHCPRFVSFPGVLKQLDGLFMALGSYRTMRRVKRRFRGNLIDAHFGYPDGLAATLLGRWLKLPVTITLRGTELRHSRDDNLRPRLRQALTDATRLFSVSDSLRRLAIGQGVPAERIEVVGNGVDTDKFKPMPQPEARSKLSLPVDAKVLISVGALVERKGFHRVIEVMPDLLESFPSLYFLIVGGAGPEGGMREELERQVSDLNLCERVRFLGTLPAEALKWPLSAADLFVLATANEGWANVILEAMACRLPVVATDVGGNAEVVSNSDVGAIVPFGDRQALLDALRKGLAADWDGAAIREYAKSNSWDSRVERLVEVFDSIAAETSDAGERS